MTSVLKTANIELLLKELVRGAMASAFPQLSAALPEPLITSGKVADYQCNNAMGLSKLLVQTNPPVKMTPQALGEELKKHLQENNLIEKFEPTPKGFINITIRNDWLVNRAHEVLISGIIPPEVPPQRVLVDFSSPNVAKEMHVGHLRSTIIGECLSRLFEFCNFDVLRINHVGDWGTAFGMLILYLKRNYPNYITNPPDISNLTDLYRASKVCFDEDQDFKEQARLEVVKLQAHEENSLKAWKLICDVSRNEFNKVYSRLGVRIEERGESFYNDLIPVVLKMLEEADLIEKNDGAKVIIGKVKKNLNELDSKDMTKLSAQHLAQMSKSGQKYYHPNLFLAMKKCGIFSGEPGHEVVVLSKKEQKPWSTFDIRKDLDKLMNKLEPLYKGNLDPLFREVFQEKGLIEGDSIIVPRFSFPIMAMKSDGGYTYDTTDLACIYHRLMVDKCNRVIYCTDVGQYEHFVMITQVAKDMHWMDNSTWDHAGFGLVTGEDGKKIKTRSGETAKLKDLLDEAVARSHLILKQREMTDRAQGHSEEDTERLSNIIGIGAVKYFDLKQTRVNDYAFNFEKMLDMSGNTAVYLLYQYARICSIKRKSNVDVEKLKQTAKISITHRSERQLLLQNFRFQSTILKTLEDLFPHHLTDFAAELMSCFSDFFTNCRVINDTLQESRLCLVELTCLTLKKMLDILNIEVTEKI
ncbi:unnamed protein product [Phytomonas sp. Hart1]|nr:unnamed protein product [Phytomonas sp. Hart1]|eukprot:CCW71064.1 unnamed protein product [Phytomonas sp. isolate Hart1]